MFDLGGAAQGGAAGAKTGNPWVAAGMAAFGGIMGGKAKAKAKAAAKLMREANAIQRMQSRRGAIVAAIQQGAMATASAYSGGFNPEGTSSAVNQQQNIYGQLQSNLKEEGMIYSRNQRAGKKMADSAKFSDILGGVTGAVQGVSEGIDKYNQKKSDYLLAKGDTGTSGSFSPGYALPAPSQIPYYIRSPLADK